MDALFAPILAYLGAFSVHFTGFALAALRRPPPPGSLSSEPPHVAVLIPAYREGEVVVRSAESVLAQRYPADRIEVVVIADRCEEDVLARLRALPITLHAVAFAESTKSHALRHALARLERRIGVVIVLDADNLAHPDLVAIMARDIVAGRVAVQGARLEKNDDTPMARLDGLMERINHAVFRQGRAAVGLSAALAGSCMAFQRGPFQRLMADIDAVGGFDKALEMELILSGAIIGWQPAAIVYDEKVDQVAAFQRQRRRWISVQLIFLRRYFSRVLSATAASPRLDPVDKLLQWVALPRSLHLVALGAVTLLAAAVGAWSAAAISAGLLALTGIGFLAAIAACGAPRGVLRDGRHVAPAGLAMIRALLRIRGADETFIHTGHDRAVGIDEVLAARGET